MRSVKTSQGVNNLLANLSDRVDRHTDKIDDMPRIMDVKIDAKMRQNDANIKAMETRMAKMEEKLITMGTCQDDMQDKIEHNSQRIENNEKSDRLDTVIIEGLIFDINKSLKANVCDEIAGACGFTIKIGDLKHVSRFRNDIDGNITAVKVKFHDPDKKKRSGATKGQTAWNAGLYQ